MVGTRQGEHVGVDLSSAREYKRGLYDKLHTSGILDNLKSHLRTRILSKLSGGNDRTSVGGQSRTREGLIPRVLDSLFTDYLKRNGYDYTLSVFLPESGLQSSSSLSLREIMKMLQIDETSQMARAIQSRSEGAEEASDPGLSSSSSCLSTLILESLAQVNSAKPLHEAETQTWDLHGVTEGSQSVSIEVQRIESRLQDRLESERASMKAIFETKMSDCRRDVEIRSRADVQAQVDRVRDMETRSIRIQESAKAWESLAKEKEELDKIHGERLAALKESELETMQRITEKWRSLEIKENESRKEIARQREEMGLERERFEDEVGERRVGLERREKALDERTSAAQVKQIEAEKLLDFAAQQLEQARLLKARTLDITGGKAGQPSSPEVAMEMLTNARKEAKDLRKKLIERTRENEDLREKIRQLEIHADTLVPRETLDRERSSWQKEREALVLRESTWQSALHRANAAVEEATNGQEEALNQLEEAKMKAALASKEASDLRSYARELQVTFDSNFYQHRSHSSSRYLRADDSSSFVQRTPVTSTAVNLEELEKLEHGLKSRLESFKSRSWTSRVPDPLPLEPQPDARPHFSRPAPLPSPRAEIAQSPAEGEEVMERDYVKESQTIMEGALVGERVQEVPAYISGALGTTLRESKSGSSEDLKPPPSPQEKSWGTAKESSPEKEETPKFKDTLPKIHSESSSSSSSSSSSDEPAAEEKERPSPSKVAVPASPGAESSKVLKEAAKAPIQVPGEEKSSSPSPAGVVAQKEVEEKIVTPAKIKPIEIPGDSGKGDEAPSSQATPTKKKQGEPVQSPPVKTPGKRKEVSSPIPSKGVASPGASPKSSSKKSSSPKWAKPSPKGQATQVAEEDQGQRKTQSPIAARSSPKPKDSEAVSIETGAASSSTTPVKRAGSPSTRAASRAKSPQTVKEAVLPKSVSPKEKKEAKGGSTSSSPLNPAAKPYSPGLTSREKPGEEERYSPSWSPKKSPQPKVSKTTPRKQKQKTPEAKSVPGGEEEAAVTRTPVEPVVSKEDPVEDIKAGTPHKGKAEEEPIGKGIVSSPPRVLESPSENFPSPHVAPYTSPQAREGGGGKSSPRREEPAAPLTVSQILTQAAKEESSSEDMSEDAEEVDSDIHSSDGSLSPRDGSGGSFGVAGEPGVMGVLPTEAPEGSPLGPPIGEPSDLSDINYSELEDIRDFNEDDGDGYGEEENSGPSLGAGQSEEMSVASFSGEGSNLSIPGLSSEGSVF
ncbi:hypothetical protein A3770_07p46660 [Chloropicon primus]|uniref:Uncharacterized protein n=1 Tax=Chloropicon primus TaxID=1764295 RepID=A0A5B8MNB6_9CHLO|nr:hypothetical protein A3770_07p46660 [Chloropicon primus]|eukprot:QDZ22148.1 hypothetical protein A3770_07p46660 [Chloropicon primus]